MAALFDMTDPEPAVPLACQGGRCRARRDSGEQSARAAGWRVWQGPTLGGGTTRVVLCPDCTGTPTPREAQ